MWRRIGGDDWAAFEALPPAVRRRMQEHAYDAWAVNALFLWRAFRRAGGGARAERRLLRYLDECEALERAAFSDIFRREHGVPLPHIAAAATVLRYAPVPASRPLVRSRRRAAVRHSVYGDHAGEPTRGDGTSVARGG